MLWNGVQGSLLLRIPLAACVCCLQALSPEREMTRRGFRDTSGFSKKYLHAVSATCRNVISDKPGPSSSAQAD